MMAGAGNPSLPYTPALARCFNATQGHTASPNMPAQRGTHQKARRSPARPTPKSPETRLRPGAPLPAAHTGRYHTLTVVPAGMLS